MNILVFSIVTEIYFSKKQMKYRFFKSIFNA
jgi:hypothetical protein